MQRPKLICHESRCLQTSLKNVLSFLSSARPYLQIIFVAVAPFAWSNPRSPSIPSQNTTVRYRGYRRYILRDKTGRAKPFILLYCFYVQQFFKKECACIIFTRKLDVIAEQKEAGKVATTI
jgi:hypothetical protein